MSQKESNELTKQIAIQIVHTLGQGIPPEYGFQFFTVGLEPYLTVIEKEYLDTFIREGGSSFKLVVGVYGGGKTHFLYCVRDIAWKYNFATSYVALSSTESPFHKLELVYRAIVNGLTPPLTPEELLSGYERGIESFIRSWYADEERKAKEEGLPSDQIVERLEAHLENIVNMESLSFTNAIKEAFRALMRKNDTDFNIICQWLKGEGYDRRSHGRFSIYQKIDRATAPQMIRSLAQWVREIGYSGLVILFDEAERIPSLSTKNKEQHLSNLREIIDECGHTHFKNIMIFYAVPDENFLEGRTQVYEALRQRLNPVFDDKFNPTGVKIELEQLESRYEPVECLEKIGEKLRVIYEVAYEYQFTEPGIQKLIRQVGDRCYGMRFGDIGYKRLFVQKLIQALHYWRTQEKPPTLEELGLVG